MADSLSDFQNSIASRGSSKDSKRDFRIKNSSTNARAPAQKRTTLMAMNKPHQLASQNEEIKRMLGMIGPQSDTFTDLKKPVKKITDSIGDASSLKQASQSSFTKPTSTYSESKSAASVKPVRANSSVRPSLN